MIRAVRRPLVDAYLAGSNALMRCMLRGRSGERRFSRPIIVTALSRGTGITCGARLQWRAFREAGIEAELLDATPALRSPFFRMPHRPGSVYIFHSAAPETASLMAGVLPHVADAYRIGYWAWELPDPPLDWSGCDRNVHEVWTPSAFSKAALVALTDRPVEIVPHCIKVGPARQPRPGRPFTVLTMADSRSSWSRKNPEGALRAFRAAFGASPSARFILKLSGRNDEIKSFERGAAGLLDANNIEISRGYLSNPEMEALYDEADVFLSLHRAEGYGLPMNEAMSRGIPVVATGWSGNLDFMSESDSSLVGYSLIPVMDESSIYSASVWADPDIASAARALRRLADEPDEYARLAMAAYRRARSLTPRFPFMTPGMKAEKCTETVDLSAD